jgi:sugar-specific transcriptional regulator TrmB
MFLIEPLKKLGLSEKEARVYLATLEIGGGTVQEISEQAGVKRPTTYVILDQLVHKALIFEEKRMLGSMYIAANPEVFEKRAREQKRVIEDSLPFLQAMYAGEKSKPQVRVYEGAQSMEKIYLETFWQSKTEILFFSSIKKVYELFPRMIEDWLEHSKKGGIAVKSRELVNPDLIDIEYGLRATKVNENTQVRVIAGSPLPFVGSDNAIMEDKIIMVSLEGKLFTTVIQNKVLADTMRTLYELAWQSATPIQKFAQKIK